MPGKVKEMQRGDVLLLAAGRKEVGEWGHRTGPEPENPAGQKDQRTSQNSRGTDGLCLVWPKQTLAD
jgi:hypothetical protein